MQGVMLNIEYFNFGKHKAMSPHRSRARGLKNRLIVHLIFNYLLLKQNPLISTTYSKLMAERTGLEPATPGVTGRYSNQLNYHSTR